MTVKIVGHRGWPQRYPENSLVGVLAALDFGADAVEVDIQFSRDGTPLVLHDGSTKRTGDAEAQAQHCDAETLMRVSVHEPARFGAAFYPCALLPLWRLAQALRAYPRARLFVEVKAESFAYCSREWACRAVVESLAAIAAQCVIISYDAAFLARVQAAWDGPVGRVLDAFNPAVRDACHRQACDFLICDRDKIPRQSELWPGPWEWFIYDLVSPGELPYWRERGARWIETWDVAALCPPLASR